ncbi:MAG: NAD(P)H-dependent flavin oxidoreductase [Bacillota bacterium]
MKPLKFGNLRVPVPIVQGGMGVGISMSNLASAVANQGGVGVISAAGTGMYDKDRNKDYLKASLTKLASEIKIAKRKTKGILGVNIMVALTGFGDMVKTAIDEGIDIIFAGAGLPLDLPKHIKEGIDTKIVPIISSARAAKIITHKWLKNYDYLPDGFVIEGPKAGGHLGFKPEQMDLPEYQLEAILKKTKETLKPFEEKHGKSIPLIVAGGIYDSSDVRRYLDMGASGVQLGTRFVATEECDASDAFKETFINAQKSDIRLINSPVGLPGRAIHNPFLEAVDRGEKHPFACPFDCIKTCAKEDAPYCISLALYNAKAGKMKRGFAFAGENAYRVDKIMSVKALFEELTKGISDTRLDSTH